MKFLQNLQSFGKKLALAAVIAGMATVSVYSQKGQSYGEAGFMGESIDLNVVNVDIREVLNHLTQEYGINFVIDSSVKQTPITTNLNNVPWNLALDAILQSQGLAVELNGPILRVADAKKLADEYEVRDRNRQSKLDGEQLYTEFIRLNYARATGTLAGAAGDTGTFKGGTESGGSGSTSSLGGDASGTGGDTGIMKILQKRMSRRGSIETDGRSNTLIVTDVRQNIDAIRQLVALLDQPEPQVEIESRIVVANRAFSRDVGVQLAGLVIGKDGAGAGGGTIRPGGIRPDGYQVPLTPNNALLSAIPSTVIGLTTGIFGTARLDALITAGEEKGQAKTIATPRVTTLNNRPAQIESGQQIPIVTTQSNSAGGGSTVTFTTTYISVPLRLSVTPQITDAGTVLLRVVAENNSLSRFTTSGGTPGINTQRMQTEVMVPDGGTTVVGGALLDSEGEDQFRTPGISKVPILGNLFKRKAVSRQTSEILFFITPRIYRPDYFGNPTTGKVSDGNRTTTILQPVPLGNPDSNSGAPAEPKAGLPSAAKPEMAAAAPAPGPGKP